MHTIIFWQPYSTGNSKRRREVFPKTCRSLVLSRELKALHQAFLKQEVKPY